MKNIKTASFFLTLTIFVAPFVSAMKPSTNPEANTYETGNTSQVNGGIELASKKARQDAIYFSDASRITSTFVVTPQGHSELSSPSWISVKIDGAHRTRLSPDLRLGRNREEQASDISQSLQLCVAKESLDEAIEKIIASFKCSAPTIDGDIICAIDTIDSYTHIPQPDAALRQFLHKQLLIIESILAAHSYSNYMVDLKISEIKSHLALSTIHYG